MSLIRERPDSPTERTDFKKRSVQPSKEEFTILEDAPSPINKLHTICKGVDSPIYSLFPDFDPIGLILANANHDPPALRMERMEADPSFKPCLRGITSATHKTILRVFFSILFSHWTEKGELTELDKRMGKDVFERRMFLIANYTPIIDLEMLDDVVEIFVHDIEEASQAKDMEPFREWLVLKYGTCENVDAILEEAKTDISRYLDTCQKSTHPRCDGKKARIKITMTNGEYTGFCLETYN